MIAAIALVAVSTQCSGPASFDRRENFHLWPGETFPEAEDELPAGLADDISHLPGWPLHGTAVSGVSICLDPAATMIWSSGLTAACRWRRDK